MAREKCDLFECDNCGVKMVTHPVGCHLVSGNPFHLYVRKLTDKERTLVNSDTGLCVDNCGRWKLLGVIDADPDTDEIFSTQAEYRELTEQEKVVQKWNEDAQEGKPIIINIVRGEQT